MTAPADDLLREVERCYDAIPRRQSTVEDVGPFTLFRATPETGWDFYARPSLGSGAIDAEDVRRVLARQTELGLPRAIEWVDEVTPSLLSAVREAVTGTHELELCPLLVLPASADLGPARPGVRRMKGDEPEFERVLGTIHAGFADTDEVEDREPRSRRTAIANGWLVVVGASEADGTPVGGGSATPRDGAAELMGIATVPRARRRGWGAAVTRELARAVRDNGATTVYLAAASDGAAGVYRSVGFERVGTACILSVD